MIKMIFSSIMLFMGFVAFFTEYQIVCAGCFIAAAIMGCGIHLKKGLHDLDMDWLMDIALRSGAITAEEFVAFCKKDNKKKGGKINENY